MTIDWKYCSCGCDANIAVLGETVYTHLFKEERHFLRVNNDLKWKEFSSKEDLEKFMVDDSTSRINFAR
jgi:hypothetical protein